MSKLVSLFLFKNSKITWKGTKNKLKNDDRKYTGQYLGLKIGLHPGMKIGLPQVWKLAYTFPEVWKLVYKKLEVGLHQI